MLCQGESVFRLRNVNIVYFYYLFNCATCVGHMTILKYTYLLFIIYVLLEDGPYFLRIR
jgi:hypothetical protein